jgi:hypothetical protein
MAIIHLFASSVLIAKNVDLKANLEAMWVGARVEGALVVCF